MFNNLKKVKMTSLKIKIKALQFSKQGFPGLKLLSYALYYVPNAQQTYDHMDEKWKQKGKKV